MGLETGAYIAQLNSSNPASSDQRKQGDDHLRLIKLLVKQTMALLAGGFTSGGTSTALTLTTGHSGTPTLQEQVYAFRLHTAIGAAATLNVDALGALNLQKLTTAGWANVAANDYPSGAIIYAVYDSTATVFKILNSFPWIDTTLLAALASANIFTATQTIKSSDAGAGLGPVLALYRDSASPADNDLIGQIKFQGEDDAGNTEEYANHGVQILDVTGATEDAIQYWQTKVAGALATRMWLGGGLVLGAATGGDKGAGTLNLEHIYINDVELTGAVAQQLVQSVGNTTSAVGTSTTAGSPIDDTAPQNTEGDQYLSQAITPTDAANILEIEVELQCHSSQGGAGFGIVMALFQDATASALAAKWHLPGIDSLATAIQPYGVTMRLSHRMVAGTTSATTFKVRAGHTGSASGFTVNGESGSRRMGGISCSSIRIKEVLP